MKLAVSYDKQGNILTMFDPEQMRGKNMTLSYVPAKGEQHQVMELPREFEVKPFSELHNLLRVNASGPHPKLEPRK